MAFSTSLQPEEVDEAYFLGQTSNHEELADFLKQYERDFPYPATRPVAYLQSVAFQTPYEQIVVKSQRGGATYSRTQAEEAYRANAGLVVVRAVFALRLNYSGPLPQEDSFGVVVSQGKGIAPRKIASTVLCDPYNQVHYQYSVNRDCSTYARELVLQFDASQFGPGRVTVEATVPMGEAQETKFNLDKLK